MVNNKCYIGQTKNFKKRISGHKHLLNKNKHENPHLQNSWNKYGEENFKFEIIDRGENYNDLEKQYIKKYKSNTYKYGYNILNGGENPPVGSHRALSDIDVMNIINMLQDKTVSFDFICTKYNMISKGQINKINRGKSWKDNNLKYPLRENDDVIGIEIAQKVVEELKHTNKTQKIIAKENGISRTCVTAINLGKVELYKILSITYPIRKQ